jgi:hypothetical protein
VYVIGSKPRNEDEDSFALKMQYKRFMCSDMLSIVLERIIISFEKYATRKFEPIDEIGPAEDE